MNQAELAQARHRTYALLSRLFLQGLTAELAEVVAQLPVLSDTLPKPLAPAQLEALQASHYTLFSLNLLPYETLFLTDERELGHETTQSVARLYLETGYRGDWGGSADHVGHELAFVAFLCGAEADAWQDGQLGIAEQVRQKLADFLQAHLLRWVVPLALAIHQQGDAFFTAVSTFLLDFLADHTAVLPLDPSSPLPLPTPPDLLADPQTRLKDIARYMLVPAYTGMVLTKESLHRFGRALDLPRGFGTRRQMLVTLLEGAGQYDQWLALMALLAQESARWGVQYEDWHGRVPTLAPYIAPWQNRRDQHQTFLAHLQAHAQAVTPAD
ncbi:MAG: molecular chaperone TorD family protein [Anaerolineales bacterium]|nr:molecular chaperone TorD family protein [Anaerolineales bacterium]